MLHRRMTAGNPVCIGDVSETDSRYGFACDNAVELASMKNIKLTIAYDGAEFHGWQAQPGVTTIQGAINEAARKITQERIVAQGASRTDAGVHALGQVAHFKTR